MILVIAGTREGREAASRLREAGYSVLATATTDYGGKLLEEDELLEVKLGTLAEPDLRNLIKERGIRTVVDASHPFAETVSRLAIRVCGRLGVEYLRLERRQSLLPGHPLVHRVNSWAEAARLAGRLGKTLFLTIGTRHLTEFVNEVGDKRLIVRVLPTTEAIQTCDRLGIPSADIIALQGPFSREFNRAMFQAYGADVVVTKESGATGGVDSKIEAALDLGRPIVVVSRPVLDYPQWVETVPEVIDWIRRSDRR